MVVSDIEQTNNNNIRITEVNTYYGEQYKSYTELLKNIVWFSFFILILSIIKQKGLLPEAMLNSLIGLVMIVGIFYSLWIYYDFSRRSNMNFNEYDWGVAKPPLPNENKTTPVNNENEMKSLSESLGIDCVGMECCSDGMVYDDVLRKCISPIPISTPPSSSSSSSTTYTPISTSNYV
jgi:hypothetical protein